MAGDVHPNTGLSHGDIFHCDFCQISINWSNSGIGCEECEVWYHPPFLCSSKYEEQGINSISSTTQQIIAMPCFNLPALFNFWEESEGKTNSY